MTSLGLACRGSAANRRMNLRLPLLLAWLSWASAALPAEPPAQKFGLHEVTFTGTGATANPFDTVATVRFTPPSGAARGVTVHAFPDGGTTWRARVYVSEPGAWTWTSTCATDPALHGKTGSFAADDSARRGRLLVHPQNPHQWITEDGRWFLNLNDTAYFILSTHDGEGRPVPFADFTAYVRDATDRGITSFRSFLVSGPAPFHKENRSCRHRWDEMFADASLDQLRLAGLQETDRRLRWLHDHHPDIAVQLILFPLEKYRTDDTFWHGLTARQKERLLRHLVARYAAFPSIFWLIVNDAHFAPVSLGAPVAKAMGVPPRTLLQFPHNIALTREVGTYLQRHDPWQHPRSTGPTRKAPFYFGAEAWATYVHLEDNFDLGAAGIEAYRALGKPVFLGEDRYEQDHPSQDPEDMRFFQRRLFWSWLLAGGSTNYGGRWWVVQPYAQTGRREATSPHGGNSPPVFSRPLVGLDSVRFIRDYFTERNLDLSAFTPDPSLVRDAAGRTGAQAPKLMRRGNDEFLAYHPNTHTADKAARVDATTPARLRIDLTAATGRFLTEWFRPIDGVTAAGSPLVGGGDVELTSPWPGHDAVLRLHRPTPVVGSTPAPSASARSLVGHYPFEEGSGTAVRDHSGRGNHGRIIGAPAWTEGRRGRALYLDGKTLVNLGDRGDLHFAEPEFTITLWVKPVIGLLAPEHAKFGRDDYHWTLVSDRNSWAGSGYNAAFFSSRTSTTYQQPAHYYTLEFIFRRTKPGGDNRIETWHDPDKNIPSTNSLEIVDGQWHHLALRVSREPAHRAIFVDGLRREFRKNMVTDFYERGTGDVIIGGFPNKPPGFWEFRGAIDEIKFFNRALPDDEVRVVMESR